MVPPEKLQPQMPMRAVVIHHGLAAEPAGYSGDLVGQIGLAEVMKDGAFKFVAVSGSAVIIHGKDDEAFLRHHLVPQECGPFPGVHNILNAGAAVDVYEDRILFGGVKIGRLNDFGVEHGAIGTGHAQKLDGGQVVAVELFDLISRKDGHRGAIRFVKSLRRRLQGSGVGIYKMPGAGSEIYLVYTRTVGEEIRKWRRDNRSFRESETVQLPLDRTLCVSGEIDLAGAVVYSDEVIHVQAAAGELQHLLAR